MGLLPYTGQFSTERHGWIHAPDIHEKRDWEEELEKRGLVVQKPEPTSTVFPEADELMSMSVEELEKMNSEKSL